MARLDHVPIKLGKSPLYALQYSVKYSLQYFLKSSFLLGFLLGVSNSETIRAQPSNTYFIVQEIAKVMEDSSFAHFKGHDLALSMDAPAPVNSLLQQAMIDRGFRLFYPSRQDSMIQKVVITPQFTLSFSAKKNKKGYRSLQGYIVATVVDHRDQIINTHTLPIDVKDSFEVHKKQVEDDMWDLARFSEPRNHFDKWNALLEPTIIISAVTTSIYLLFNVRSR
jgi:hypothetical protein